MDVYKDTINEYYWRGNTIIYGNANFTNDALNSLIKDINELTVSDSLRQVERFIMPVDNDSIFFAYINKYSQPTTITFAHKYVFDEDTGEISKVRAINIFGDNYSIEEAVHVILSLFYGDRVFKSFEYSPDN